MVPTALFTPPRDGQRFHLALPMTVRVQKDSIPIHPRRQEPLCVEAATITENISSRGCYFPLSRRLPVGTHLELAIKLPGERIGLPGVKLYCKGEVIRVDDPSNAGQVCIASSIDSYRLAQAPEKMTGQS
jgi:hypothetical protein